MKKIFVLSFVLVLLSGTSSQATFKIDAGGTAAEITKTVSNSVEKVKKKFEENATIQTIIAYGKGAAETAKQLKSIKEDASTWVEVADPSAQQVVQKENTQEKASNVSSEKTSKAKKGFAKMFQKKEKSR